MNNEKVKSMTDFVVSAVVAAIMEEARVSAQEAMEVFYNSEVFDRLTDAETGLYRESGGYVYDLYKIEREHGRLVQLEI
jgi:hypothetical protein